MNKREIFSLVFAFAVILRGDRSTATKQGADLADELLEELEKPH